MKQVSPRPAALLLATLAAALPAAAMAANSDEDTLTGDWNGRRSALAERGIEVALGYTSEDLWAVDGGDPDGFAHAGQLSARLSADLGRLWGWQGTRASVALSQRDGRNINDRASIDALLGPQEIYGRGNVTRLAELSLAHVGGDGRYDWKLGRLTPGGDFGYQQCHFNNTSFCGSQAGNFVSDYWYNWPISQWGGVLGIAAGDHGRLKLGIYQVNPAYLQSAHALSLAPSGTTGTLSVAEYAWRGAGAGWKAGGWYSSAPRSDVANVDADGGFLQHSGSSGGYLSGWSRLAATASGDVRGFVNLSAADRRTSTVDRTLAAGVVWTGPLASRPGDEAGVALSLNHVNDRVSAYQRRLVADDALAGARLQTGTERVLELYYGVHLLPGLQLRPGMQWLHDAGGRDRADVLIVGMRSILSF